MVIKWLLIILIDLTFILMTPTKLASLTNHHQKNIATRNSNKLPCTTLRLQYYKVLQSTTAVLVRTKGPSLYCRVALDHSVAPSAPGYVRAIKGHQSITKVYTPILLRNTKYDSSASKVFLHSSHFHKYYCSTTDFYSSTTTKPHSSFIP